jgi:hypothetical protein
LKDLNISDCKIINPDFVELETLILTSKTIETIDLSNNNFTQDIKNNFNTFAQNRADKRKIKLIFVEEKIRRLEFLIEQSYNRIIN